MLPAALTAMLEEGVADFLRMSFWSSTPGMETVIDRFVATEGAVFKGPFVSVKLPFRAGGHGEMFPEVPLGYPAHLHQERAWARLGGAAPRSTLVATGTGSGKTESFLIPILDHCRRSLGTPGVKAILIYPMNALATDQARRIAELCSSIPALAGVRAGLYIGESVDAKGAKHGAMGAEHIITDRARMQKDPPDILLTNYKMLDYLLVRPADQDMWAPSATTPVRFLVVDELHSFDGAQGTDLACLIRRLKARLGATRGSLCCVGTSATLGGPEAAPALREYAAEVLGEPFDAESVIGETRQMPEEFFKGRLIELVQAPRDKARLDPSRYGDPAAFVVAQEELWFDERVQGDPGTDVHRVALGERLLGHAVLRNLLQILGERPVAEAELVESLARTSKELRDERELARQVVVSFLSLVSEARAWLPEREQARQRREEAGRPRPTRPLVEVRVQLWQRELRRMVADIGLLPSLRYSDDLTDDQRARHLPIVHCRDCGAMGWGTVVARDRPDVFSTGLDRFYRAFFADDPQVRFLWPAAAFADRSMQRFYLDPSTLTRITAEPPAGSFKVAESANVHTVAGRRQLHRDCPFCGARESLTLLGFRASTLTSVFIDQLFASRFNEDKKLLAFSDSVQDAAHRAGFFGARTWLFNLRVAVQKVVERAEGKTLAELPALFQRAWRRSASPSAEAVPGIEPLDDVEYVAAFLAPNMEWLAEYEAMIRDEALAPGAPLVTWVDRRVAFEIAHEYGQQARIGRSLPRTGCSTLAVDPARLDRATDGLLDRLRNEVGGLRTLDRETLRTFLIGALTHLREVGGIDHPELPRAFVETAGDDVHAFKREHHLPSYARRSRTPTLLTSDRRSRRFDDINAGGASGWYDRWVVRAFGHLSALMGEPGDVWGVVVPGLVGAGILKESDAKRGKVWGLAPEALRVTTECARLRCPACRHWLVIAGAEAPSLRGRLCLNAPCTGAYADDTEPVRNYFGRVIERGEVERVFPEEHTGLLDREQRERVETEFKSRDRKPWYPNLLSCTPTLEMGIDIGSLSSAILCSVPPGQANYLQRIGRAGRRDGNSFVLTIAQARPHDLYFYAKPEEMFAGHVQPPGVFLNASAVLERQLTAFSLDRWNASPGQHRFAPRLREVFNHLEAESEDGFPRNWLGFVHREQSRILAEFIALFNAEGEPPVLHAGSVEHLRGFLLGDGEKEGSLAWKILDALNRERKSLDSLRRKARRLRDLVKELKTAVAKDKDHAEKIAEHEDEQVGYEKLARAIDGTSTLEFLTNEGLFPNYAFPEAPVRLRSIIWRRKAQTTDQGYETRTFEYTRPPSTALGDLAPTSQFYAGGRRVEIDQVDVETANLEMWRFCDACSHCAPADHEEGAGDCPACGSPGWGEASQRRQLLRLQQVFARTSDKDSRIRDDREDRQPRYFNRHMLPTFTDEDTQGAWRLATPAVPFAFEYLRRASFREINFGEHTDTGIRFSIAGRFEGRDGFTICKRCGKVQRATNPQQRLATGIHGDHVLWCPAKQRGEKEADFEAAVYLYREFSSEAVRLLLPLADVGSDRRLCSFLAAFQLGLKDRYGGRVDHLHTLLYSEPERGSLGRRQYLVLYDGVPGGTGYLKDLMRDPPPGEEHALLDVLRRARDRIRSCECSGDPACDGCYRCLFAYRNSGDMSETSAREALAVLTEILDQAHTLTRTQSLSNISVAGLMDSVLEARFIAALERFARPDRPVALRKSLVRGKPGYQLSAGDQTWLVEPQVTIGAAQGLPIGVSVDFVLRQATIGSARAPVAVFLDGLQFHKDRVGRDMLQRMALLSGSDHDVWCFTWDDVDAAFKPTTTLPPLLSHPDGEKLKAWYKQLGLGAFAHVVDTRPLELFVASLSTAKDAVPWSNIGAVALIAQMGASTTVDVAAWREELDAVVPEPLGSAFLGFDDASLFARRPAESPGLFALWAAASQSAVRDTDARGFHAVVWLDDSAEHRDTPAFREAWRGYLFAFLLLRALPHVLFLTRTGADPDGYRHLAHMRTAAPEGKDEAWLSIDVGPDFASLVDLLAAAGVDLPSVGIDLPDARGLSSGIEGELVWESRRLAVVPDLEPGARGAIASGWTVLTITECGTDAARLIDALRRTPGGDPT